MNRLPTMALAVLVTHATSADAAQAHKVAYSCFPMHGALADDLGHPSYRITPETADGLIAVRDGDRRPAYVWRLLPKNQRAVETTITGDFVICPLEGPQPGKLRLATIKSARNLKVHIDNWLETNR